MQTKPINVKAVYLIVFFSLMIIAPTITWAQDVFTLDTSNGDWNNPSHWSIARDGNNPGSSFYPGQTAGSADGADSVIIPIDSVVTLDADVPNDVGPITINAGSQMSFGSYSLTADGLVRIYGTVFLGSGANTFSGGMTIYTGATFNADNGTIILGGNLTINGIGSGTTFNDSTATFQFPDPNAYVISSDGNISFDKIAHTTSNTSGSRTLEFAGTGSPTITIKSSFERGGNSQGTIVNTASLAYSTSGNGASLIYDPATSIIVDVDEWPSGAVPNLVLQSGTVTFPIGTYTIDNKLTRVNGIVNGTGTIEFNSSNETTLEYAPSPAAAVTVGSEWPSGATTRPSNVTIVNSGNTVTASGSDRVIPGTLTMTAGTLAMGSNNLSVIGTISGSDIADGGSVTSSGTITMGNGAGTDNQFNQDITGNVTLSNLTINKADTDGSNSVFISGSPVITSGMVITNGDVEINGGSLTISSGGLTLNNASTITNTSGSLTISSGSLTANNTAFIIMTTGATAISVSTIDLNNSATYRTGGKVISGLSTLTTDVGTTFEFNGTSTESTPLSSVTFGNLNMNNSAGLDINGTVTVNGTLTFGQNATINTDASNSLILSTTAAAIAGAMNDTRYVNGPLRKQFSGTGSYVFQVGTTARRPATFEWVTGSFGGTSIIEITHGGSFSAKTPPSGIATIDENTHYVVQDVGTPPGTPYTYNFTGTFEDENFNPETRNRAMPETASSYTLAGTNTVNTTANTVQSGTFSALPVGNYRFVFGATTLAGAVAWDGDTDNNWFEPTNWDGDFVPLSTNFVTIGGNVTVNIGGTGAAVCSTLTLGDGTNLATINITSSNANPLTIYETSGTPLAIEANSILIIDTTNSLKFDPTGSNSYDPARTNFKTGSIVEYRSEAEATVQVDNYGNLIINGATGSTGSGTINVSGTLTDSSTTFTSGHSINVTGSYLHDNGAATYSGGSGLLVSGSQFNLNGGTIDGTVTINSPTINVNGGSFVGTVTFSGSSSQSLVPVVAASFNNLTMNKTSNNLTINGANGATVTGTLTLTQGLISTSSGLLTISSGSTGSNSSHIDGPLVITGAASKTFPIGKDGIYKPVVVTGTSGSTQFEMFNSDPAGTPGTGLAVISTVRYWLGSGSISGGSITLPYSAGDGVIDPADLRVAKSTTVSGIYDSRGLDTGGSGGTISSIDTLNSLGYFTLGSATTDNPLPVELAAFEALADFSKIELTWTTASENNNLGFNIYKTVAGENSWNKLNSNLIDGQGTASYASNYSFIDSKIISGKTYRYKLESISINGLAVEEKIVEVSVPIPDQYVLLNNYPNPFNPTTNIKFQLPEAQQIRLAVYDLNGSLVKTIANNQLYPIGEHIVSWNATDNAGNRVATGIYLYRFQAGNFVKTGKMILIK